MKEVLLNSTKWKLRSPWLIGQLTIWAFVLVGALITAIFLRYSSLQMSTLPTITFSLNAGGLLLGGFMMGRKTGQKGWVYGGLQGLIYTAILLIVSFLAFDAGMRISPILFGIFSFSISAIGGILGVNSK